MEQLNITATKDNEKIYRILGDLMNGDKEFQIMITVPSGKGPVNKNAPQELPKTPEVLRNLEQEENAARNTTKIFFLLYVLFFIQKPHTSCFYTLLQLL